MRAVLFLVLILGFVAAPRPSDAVLIRIDHEQAARIPERWLSAVSVLQELDSCSIAETSGDLLDRLREMDIGYEVLDTSPGGKPYYLVSALLPEDYAVLENRGNVRKIEDAIFLFWCEREDVREVLPAHLQLKRLPSETNLRWEARQQFVVRQEAERTQIAEPQYPDPRISQMVGRVSEANLAASIQNLQDFQTRYAPTAGCESAAAYLYSYFEGLGLQCAFDSFDFASRYSSRNVVATLTGEVAPGRVVILCAHYDSTSNEAAVRAPGADDDGSGTAAVMEIARVMLDQSFDFTVRFICFSAEEWGLWGSKHYAQQARQRGEKIIAVINLDMIGYADRLPEDLDIIGNPASGWLVNRFIASSSIYTPLDVLKRISASATGSDHSPFWDQGYSAVCGIEDAAPVNPNYHKPTDTIDTLNIDFVAAVTRASLAASATLAQPVSTPPAPSGLNASSQVIRSLFSRFKSAYLSWSAGSGAIAGYRVYRAKTTHTDYQLIGSTNASKASFVDRFLDPGVDYFYVVTAVDTQGRESNYSEEVRDDESNRSR